MAKEVEVKERDIKTVLMGSSPFEHFLVRGFNAELQCAWQTHEASEEALQLQVIHTQLLNA